jgi:uncharacterized protein (DUF3084 family)
MAQPEQRMISAPEGAVALQAKTHQLQILVGELLATNQELRFKVATLEQQTKNLERGLRESSAAGALWP